ncbi:MAG TPA: acyltransferase, partial [Flavisolibacter sp.]|nr:acyltransferase [Flavisolibacter sp.]
MKVHPLADVQSTQIGEGTTIWQFAVVLKDAVIGKSCNINCHTFIENDVVIGDNVTVKSGTYIWDAIRIGDDVFLGPNVVFTNDLRPRSKKRVGYPLTTIGKGASIGANSTILAGVAVGDYAMTGIASVVTRDVPAHALVYGNPARIKGWVDTSGRKLKQVSEEVWEGEDGKKYL